MNEDEIRKVIDIARDKLRRRGNLLTSPGTTT